MRGMFHVQQGLAPSQGRLDWTHWSHACLDVVARIADVDPLRRCGAEEESGFSFGWHLLTCRDSKSLKENTVMPSQYSGSGKEDSKAGQYLLANWSPQCWQRYGRSPVSG